MKTNPIIQKAKETLGDETLNAAERQQIDQVWVDTPNEDARAEALRFLNEKCGRDPSVCSLYKNFTSRFVDQVIGKRANESLQASYNDLTSFGDSDAKGTVFVTFTIEPDGSTHVENLRTKMKSGKFDEKFLKQIQATLGIITFPRFSAEPVTIRDYPLHFGISRMSIF